ncbi:hypothetical protein JXJ21_12515 [candidate division KSB1 bacterium]|nr:hypothetical protein [candidate division KSB1 bacterium]
MSYKILSRIPVIFLILILFGFYLNATDIRAQEKADSMKINEHLKPLLPFVGKTWKSEFHGSTPEKPVYDVQHWELILNGQAIRIMHSLNEGAYGGETIVMWDKEKKQLIYFYFTTAGFYTQGTFSFDGKKWIGHENVTGNKEGITEVKSIGEILPDGRLHSKSQYLKNGDWVDGHEFFYVEDPGAKVEFKF